MHFSRECDNLSQAQGVVSLTEYLSESNNSLLKAYRNDGLEIIVQCPTLESLENLLNDCGSGRLNEVAERCLVTDEIKTILDLETVRLKTVIEKKSYLEVLRECFFFCFSI